MALTGSGGKQAISKSIVNPGQTSIFKKSPAVAPTKAPSPGVAQPRMTSTAPPSTGPSYTPGYDGPAAPAMAAPGPAAPPPMTDVDWFNKDSVFRNAATVASNDLVDQLAQLLFQRNQGFQAVDNQRRDWGQARDRDIENIGEDFAARGLSSSGLYKQGYDDMMSEYERRNSDINQGESQLIQQLGARDSLAGGIDRGALIGDNYNALAQIYGLLGQQGVSAGNAYAGRIQGLRGESAGRANQDLIKTLGW